MIQTVVTVFCEGFGNNFWQRAYSLVGRRSRDSCTGRGVFGGTWAVVGELGYDGAFRRGLAALPRGRQGMAAVLESADQ